MRVPFGPRPGRVASLVMSLAVLLTSGSCTSPPAADPTVQPTATSLVAQARPTDVVAPVPTAEPNSNLPGPLGTITHPTPGQTPSLPVPTITPTPAPLEPARLVTPSTVSTVTLGLDVQVSVQGIISGSEEVEALDWSPHGDGLIYLTVSGKLYWVDIASTKQTLLYAYEYASRGFDPIRDQVPLSDVLYLVHIGKETDRPRSGHMDMLRFTPGQPPTFEERLDLPVIWGLRWWGPDRVSGLLGRSYNSTDDPYIGGDRLVTLDAQGRIVEDRNIPYMQSGEVQPGGEWLAYGTGQQSTNVPFSGSEPTTGYLLNLRSGERLQVSPSGSGSAGKWSPNGEWFMGSGVMSKDGQELIVGASGSSGHTWHPDSTRFASYSFGGGCEPEGDPPCHPYETDLFIVDLPSRKQTEITEHPALKDLGLLARPKWSPDGKLLATLVLDGPCAECPPAEGEQPRIYLLSVDIPRSP